MLFSQATESTEGTPLLAAVRARGDQHEAIRAPIFSQTFARSNQGFWNRHVEFQIARDMDQVPRHTEVDELPSVAFGLRTEDISVSEHGVTRSRETFIAS